MISCVQIEPAGEPDGFQVVKLHARIEKTSGSPDSKATVSSDGIVSWSGSDKIAVYTSESAIKTFDCVLIEGGMATFSGLLDFSEEPSNVAVYPESALNACDGENVTIVYPSEYSYAQDAMPAPMAAVIKEGTLNFKQLGGMLHIECATVPSAAVALYIEAPERKITGSFSVQVTDNMSLHTTQTENENIVKVTFPSGIPALDFNIPVPVGDYPVINARFVDSSDAAIMEWAVLNNAEIERADMYVRQEPDVLAINGTLIKDGNDLYGLVSDSSTGEGLAGVPVTDGYTYTVTDENGVYQFVADQYSRSVYPSIPARYEIPVSSEDGQPAFWKTAKGRNDFVLTPRSTDWREFSILGISDVHFYVQSKDDFIERDIWRSTALPDINSFIAGYNNVIAINTGDITSNKTKRLADTRAEFSLIKKNGVTVPMFHAIGNHDHSNDPSCNSTWECSADYVSVFGPTEYSINIGNAHIVFLNNIIYAGHQEGGYGKAMLCDFGLTDEIYSWLEGDLAFVQDKQNKILILCVHAPIFNNQHPHYGDIRNILKTFGEAHILSGHDHHNIRREFSDSWKGLNGKVPEEHNMLPLGNYWLNDYTTAGVPNGYHVFTINGASMTQQHFKATGISETDCQFRIYDSSERYQDPIDQQIKGGETLVDENEQIYFDWHWEFADENFDKDHGVIVRVFDAGSRALDCMVWFVQNGVRNEMTRVANPHRDQWSFWWLWNYGWQKNDFPNAYHRGRRYQNYWYYELPSGTLSQQKDWKVEVELNGRKYESSVITR